MSECAWPEAAVLGGGAPPAALHEAHRRLGAHLGADAVLGHGQAPGSPGGARTYLCASAQQVP